MDAGEFLQIIQTAFKDDAEVTFKELEEEPPKKPKSPKSPKAKPISPKKIMEASPQAVTEKLLSDEEGYNFIVKT